MKSRKIGFVCGPDCISQSGASLNDIRGKRCSREETRAGARGFFYGKNQLHLGDDRQRTSVVRPQTHMVIHPRSEERGILAFSRHWAS